MKCVFLMDPLESIKLDKDTTFILMLECARRGHEVYFVAKDGLSLLNGDVHFHAIKLRFDPLAREVFIKEHALRLEGKNVQAVFIRPDPPFDAQYLHNTWVLDHLPKSVFVANSALGIRSVNEKIWASQFKNFVPPNIISSNKHDLLEFIAEHQNIIAKPTNSFGGQSVFHIEPGNTNTKVILETLSKGYNEPIILQRYIPEAKNGDKRILLLNGEFLGVLLRVHGEGEHRNNFYAGGKPAAAELNSRDQAIISALKPHLQQLGLYFVGIDILGDYLIEVNVTSPTCLQEMNRLYNVSLEQKVINFVEQQCQH